MRAASSKREPVYDEAQRARLRANLAKFERHGCQDRSLRCAAVALALLADSDGRACFVLTRRADNLRTHAGQWALPGGRVDDGEGSEAAALRELREEVCIDVGRDAVLGMLDDYPTRSGFVITPVVVWCGDDVEMTPDPREVAAAYRVPIAELERDEVPELHSIPESDAQVISVPLLGTHIHAPTAALLYQFREVAMRGLATRVDHYEQPVFAWR